VSIYDLPPEALRTTQPINALRARQVMRPLCFNRPDFPALVEVQDGWQAVCLATPEGLTATIFAPAHDVVPNRMSKDCKAWAVHPSEDPAAESVPARECWRCWGCRHLPEDPRVVIAAAGSEVVP
jgi:hypothetical protein